MRILGIDYGTKRVGLALTDDKGMMAFPHSVVPNDEKLMNVVETIIKNEGVTQVVIGHSVDKEGNPNAVQERIEAFLLDLTLATGVPIELEKERYTTQEAMRIQGKHALTDASAAALILDSFITRTKNKD